MPLSLHAAFVPSALQMLGTCDHLIEKARAWCDETGCGEAELIGSSLYEDMLPFAYQIKSVPVHTARAIEGVRKGVFSPDMAPPPEDFAGLSAAVGLGREVLESTTEAEMEGFIGQPMRFEIGDKLRMDFLAEDFLLTFSQPNFYFHAATAYDILRMQGVPVGKRDFLGTMRLRQS